MTAQAAAAGKMAQAEAHREARLAAHAVKVKGGRARDKARPLAERTMVCARSGGRGQEGGCSPSLQY